MDKSEIEKLEGLIGGLASLINRTEDCLEQSWGSSSEIFRVEEKLKEAI